MEQPEIQINNKVDNLWHATYPDLDDLTIVEAVESMQFCIYFGTTGRLRKLESLSRAVQLDPMKSTLRAPGSKGSKLNCDYALSNVVFKFNLRRYTSGS
jgi:hypothetical protein